MQQSIPAEPRLRKLAAWAFGEWSDYHGAGIRILFGTLSKHRQRLLSIVAANVAAGLFEGSSIVLLFFAAHRLVGDQGSTSAAPWLDSWIVFIEGLFGPHGFFVVLTLLIVLAQTAKSGLAFLAVALSADLQMNARKDAYTHVLSHIMGLDYVLIAQYDSGRLLTYVTMAKYLDNLVETSNNIIFNFVISLAYLAVLFWVSWDMTLLAVAFLVPVSFGMRTVILKIQHAARELLGAQQELNFRTLEFLSGIRLIRSFAREQQALEVLGKSIDRDLGATRRGLVLNAMVRPLMEIVAVALLAAILLGGFLFFGSNADQALPHLLVFLYAMLRLIPRVTAFNSYWANISRVLPNLVYTAEFLRQTPESGNRPASVPFGRFRHRIAFIDVALEYPNGRRPALNGVSFTIEKGQMVALVGESGAGKSSVVDLLLGLYRPTRGRILIDDRCLSEIESGSWRHRIGVVNQERFLLNAAVRDNIAFADADATEEAIVRAAKRAHAHDFIVQLEHGYDTVIGERGQRLSGGQCQRIAIARALLHDPDILILDEATSELDSESERIIQDALIEFRRDRTVVTVAHRLATVAAADKIIVLRDGLVVEIGTHEDLLRMGGVYAQLWQLQARIQDAALLRPNTNESMN